MKNLSKLHSRTAGRLWGLAFCVFMIAAGITLWLYAVSSNASLLDESVAVASMLIGAFPAVCAARELRHRKSTGHGTRR